MTQLPQRRNRCRLALNESIPLVTVCNSLGHISTMMMTAPRLGLLFAFLACVLGVSRAFVPSASLVASPTTSALAPKFARTASYTSSELHAIFPDVSLTTAASTLDPTTILSDLFSGLINTPAILAVPIVAALGLASLIAFLIVAYATPAEPDD